MLGGKCIQCGYNRNIRSLHFYHKNPAQKEFQISRYVQKHWNVVEAELEKCELLCSNCHRKKTFTKIKANTLAIQRQLLKQSIVDLYGKECVKCKVIGPTCIYDFHHIRPEEKEYTIGDLVAALNYNKLSYELTKCLLICSNCHGEIENTKEKIEIKALTQEYIFDYFRKKFPQALIFKEKIISIYPICGNKKISI